MRFVIKVGISTNGVAICSTSSIDVKRSVISIAPYRYVYPPIDAIDISKGGIGYLVGMQNGVWKAGNGFYEEDAGNTTDPSTAKVGDTKTLGDWSYTKVGNDSWETTYKGKKQPNRTDADIKRVFSGADHDSQPKKESPYSKYGFTKKPTEKMVGSIAGKYIIGDEARDITYVLTDRNGKMAMNII